MRRIDRAVVGVGGTAPRKAGDVVVAALQNSTLRVVEELRRPEILDRHRGADRVPRLLNERLDRFAGETLGLRRVGEGEPPAVFYANAVGTDFPTGLIEQRVRFGQIVVVMRRVRRPRPRGLRRERGVGEVAEPVCNLREDRLAIERHRERPPHANVLEQRLLQIEVDVVEGEDRRRAHHGPRNVLQFGPEIRADVDRHVDLVRLDLVNRRVLVGEDLEDHLVEFRLAEEIPVESLQDDLRAPVPAHEREWPAPDRRRLVGSAIERTGRIVDGLQEVRGQDRRVAVHAPQLLEKRRVDFLHVDDGDERIGAIDALDVPVAILRDVVVGWIHHRLPGELEVTARHLHAVVKIDVRSQLILQCETVFAHVAILDRRQFAQRIGMRSRALVVAHRIGEEKHRQVEGGGAGGEHRVERFHVLGFRVHEPPMMRPRIAGRSPGSLRPDFGARCEKPGYQKNQDARDFSLHYRIVSGSISLAR